ncbi:uncharacterized protein [Antedon mediterranea]|uniref:uncharacterized protein n=1 Tax=Antedon mediterranea TaxID=105859 RepID=UPI003AF987F9
MGLSGSKEDNMAATNFVETAIHDKCVVVFSKTYCPYCKMAKAALDEEGAKYEVVELDKRSDGDAIQNALAQITGARTVPRVFIKGKCIGGGSETRDMQASGELRKLLEECGNALK